MKSSKLQSKIKNYGDIVRAVLRNRGIKTTKQEKEFFNPPHPGGIRNRELGIRDEDLKKAVKRIKRAVGDGEKIIIYGDYDVDGICAAAILWETIHGLGGNCLPYIPSRFTEGYGLNIESIKKLKEEDPTVKLIITVDNGITANEKIDFAKSLGIDVIITDHHTPGKIKPRPI